MTIRTLPVKLLSALDQKGLSKTEAAFRSGIDLSRFSRITNGWVRPSPKDKRRISQALSLPEDYLFTE